MLPVWAVDVDEEAKKDGRRRSMVGSRILVVGHARIVVEDSYYIDEQNSIRIGRKYE